MGFFLIEKTTQEEDIHEIRGVTKDVMTLFYCAMESYTKHTSVRS